MSCDVVDNFGLERNRSHREGEEEGDALTSTDKTHTHTHPCHQPNPNPPIPKQCRREECHEKTSKIYQKCPEDNAGRAQQTAHATSQDAEHIC